jgi:hypothetical protein
LSAPPNSSRTRLSLQLFHHFGKAFMQGKPFFHTGLPFPRNGLPLGGYAQDSTEADPASLKGMITNHLFVRTKIGGRSSTFSVSTRLPAAIASIMRKLMELVL